MTGRKADTRWLRSRLTSDNLPAAAGAVDALADTARNDIGAVAEPASAALREVQVQPDEPELSFGQIVTGGALILKGPIDELAIPGNAVSTDA